MIIESAAKFTNERVYVLAINVHIRLCLQTLVLCPLLKKNLFHLFSIFNPTEKGQGASCSNHRLMRIRQMGYDISRLV